MKTTYLIQNIKDKSVFNYYPLLRDAKKALESLESGNWDFDTCKWEILCLKGQYYGEGYHAYKIKYFGRVFLKEVA